MRYHNDPDGTRLPIKLDPTTNGEFAPVPLAPVHRIALGAALHSGETRPRRGAGRGDRGQNRARQFDIRAALI